MQTPIAAIESFFHGPLL